MAKFIVPATYPAQVGVQKDGFTPKMADLPYDNAGEVIEVPDADADHFIEKGYELADEEATAGKKGKGKK